MPEEPIVWYVQTHIHRDRSADWYWALGLVAVLGAAISIYFSNILLAGIILIGALSIGVLAVRGPREHHVQIDGRGINVDGTLYKYHAVQSFWVAVDEPLAHRAHEVPERFWLYFTTHGYLHPHISLPLEDMSHGHEVRNYLLQFIEEEEQHPHFGEHVAELLGL